ncbi:MAG: 2-oxoglutarate dehydrogenase complex dihydrolipoyllysine-residue succinyltransferase [Aestuariivita sp.]|nr:2-oxoglutarate dehydrogenase complex dihydrolipoyllysine-residue succinyltransferase [Aestuariivita sp.]MCY4201607.1 2-oxoglutarate dehydrogenase complex dihydrolipoyllysine-residue succinyltransferase [Aestuariivita sp.]
MTIEVRVPTLGESVTEATVANWYKKPGDAVAADEMLCELETDKVTIEVPAPTAGTLGDIIASAGETVGVDALLTTIAASAGDAEAAASAPAPAKTSADEPSSEEGRKIDVMVPTLGESVTEATVSTWSKAVGEPVSQDEVLCELETDKVSIEVVAPSSGILESIHAAEGTTVEVSARLAVIQVGDVKEAPKTVAGDDSPSKASNSANGKRDAPSARKAMQEAGLSREQVQGSGRDGRIMKSNVLAAVADTGQSSAAVSSQPQASLSQDSGREERVAMTRIRQTIAKRLKDAQNTAAILTTFNEVDMGEVMALRNQYKDEFEKKHGVRLGFMSFFTKACCHALREVPEVNAEIAGTDIVYKNYVHMGIAAGTPQGLVVPVIRDADSLSFSEIEKQVAAKGKLARDGKLSMADMQGGTFTISNGGVYGSLMSAPILNPPQSGILGMHKIQERPMVIAGEIKIRPMMYLALSYDHRIVDGKGAVTFLVRVKEVLEDPRRLLMDL